MTVVHTCGQGSARLDEALALDVDGTRDAIDKARAQGQPLVLVSTLAAVGGKKGLVPEDNPQDALFGGGTVRGRDLDVDGEVEACRAAVAHAQASSSFADKLSKIAERTRKELLELGGATTGSAFDSACRAARHKDAAQAQERALFERAAGWRFATGSTWAARGYTCALAELLVARSELPWAIVRAPAFLDDEHGPLAWLLERVRAGVLRLPLVGRLDALPRDVVERAVSVVTQGLEASGSGGVVHVVPRAPLPPARLADLLDLHLRRARSTAGDTPSRHDEGSQQSVERVLSVDVARALPPGADVAARGLARLAESARRALEDGPLEGLAGALDAARSVVEVAPADRARCASPPWFRDETRLSTRGLRMFAARAGVEAPALDVEWRALLLDELLPRFDQARLERERARETLPRPAWDSLAHLLVEAAARYKNRPALSYLDGDDVLDVTYQELLDRARAVALRLDRAGVKPGDRVVLSGANHPSWGVAAFGVFLARAVLVPLDPQNLDADAVALIVNKARPVCAVVDVGVRKRLEGVLPQPVLDLALTTAEGPGVAPGGDEPPPDAALMGIRGDDVASILFTSGTTGEPKGVQLTHRNFCALLASLQAIFPVGRGDRMLSVLPLHHTFEFSCGLLMPLASGARIYTPDALTGERVLFALKKGKITALVGIPALWQLLERRITKQAAERGEVVKGVVDALLAANRAFGKRTGLSFGRIALKPIHDQLGGHLKTLISGGSALPPAVHDMFQGLGLPLAEGYGLTEAAPVLTVAEGALGAPAGTVGRAIPGVELKIVDADAHTGVGEVWARAQNVMKGYFENDDATAVTLVDGWLKTGDLGFIDGAGRLHLVGRSKDVVVTATGENVYLDDIEKKLEPLSKDDGTQVAELTLLGVADPRGGERLALAYVLTEAALASSTGAADALKRVQQGVLKLPAYARPSVIERVDGPLPLTATRKVKRKEVRGVLEETLARRAEAGGGDGAAPLQAVRAAVAVVAGVDAKKIAGGTRPAADLGFDSLMWTELGASLEKIAGGALDPEALVACETVADVEALVRAPRRGTSGATAEGEALEEGRAAVDKPGARVGWRDVALAALKPAGRRAIAFGQRELYDSVFHAAVTGRAFVPSNRNSIVIANHTSHLDTGLVKYALGAYGKDLRPLAAKDYFFEGAAPKVAFFQHFTNLVPIDRETGSGLAFEQARAVVEGGHVVLIFPEGTRREDGTLGGFKPLVARLSLLTGVDVLPIWMKGNHQALPRDALLPDLRHRELEAHIGPPLEARQLARLTAHLPPVQQAREATEIIRRAVVALSEGRMLELSRVETLAKLERGVVRRPAA